MVSARNLSQGLEKVISNVTLLRFSLKFEEKKGYRAGDPDAQQSSDSDRGPGT